VIGTQGLIIQRVLKW